MTRLAALALLLPLAPLAACGSDAGPATSPAAPPEASGDPAPTPEASAPAVAGDSAEVDAEGPGPPSQADGNLPPTQEIRTATEGIPVTLTGVLVQERDFAIPFRTYMPEGTTYRREDVNGNLAATFSFGNRPDNTATLRVFIVNLQGTLDLDGYVRGIAENEGGRVQRFDSVPEWAEVGYGFDGPNRTGSVMAGRHGGYVFYVVDSFPPEMGDGWATVSDVVLSYWEWTDTEGGSPL